MRLLHYARRRLVRSIAPLSAVWLFPCEQPTKRIYAASMRAADQKDLRCIRSRTRKSSRAASTCSQWDAHLQAERIVRLALISATPWYGLSGAQVGGPTLNATAVLTRAWICCESCSIFPAGWR